MPVIRFPAFSLLRLNLFIVVLLLAGTGAARACTFTASDVVFGQVDVLSNTPIDARMPTGGG